MSRIETPPAAALRTAASKALFHAAVGVAAFLPLTLFPASAHEYEAGSLHIEHPWARATPPRAGVAGAYMVIENHGTEGDRLLGGSTDAAGKVQIHSMTMDGGVMKMRQLTDGLELPAGETITLAPGGYHLMLVDPVKPLKEGERVPITLDFEKAGSVGVDLTVEGIGAKGPEAKGATHQGQDMPMQGDMTNGDMTMGGGDDAHGGTEAK